MKRFRWLTKRSREDCIAVTAIRMFLGNCTAEEALNKSLSRYSMNGDLMGKAERAKVLSAAKKRAWEARRVAQQVRESKARKAM